jgi:prefoldin subunit 5
MAGNGGKLGQKLLRIKEELEEKKALQAQLQGELNELMKQLQEFGAETVEEAGEILQKQENEIKDLETTIQEGIDEIEDMMNDEE